MTTTDTITPNEALTLVDRFMAAEAGNDVAAHDGLIAPEFRAVGPLGFVLARDQWLDRFQSGDFVYRSLEWSDPEARQFGDAAIVIGTQDQQATYRGQPSDGRFRTTVVVIARDGAWMIAGMHLSPIATPPAR